MAVRSVCAVQEVAAPRDQPGVVLQVSLQLGGLGSPVSPSQLGLLLSLSPQAAQVPPLCPLVSAEQWQWVCLIV